MIASMSRSHPMWTSASGASAGSLAACGQGLETCEKPRRCVGLPSTRIARPALDSETVLPGLTRNDHFHASLQRPRSRGTRSARSVAQEISAGVVSRVRHHGVRSHGFRRVHAKGAEQHSRLEPDRTSLRVLRKPALRLHLPANTVIPSTSPPTRVDALVPRRPPRPRSNTAAKRQHSRTETP